MKAILLLCLLAVSFVVSSCNSSFRRKDVEDVVDLIKVVDQLLSLEVDEIMEILDNELVGIQIQLISHKKKLSKPKTLRA